MVAPIVTPFPSARKEGLLLLLGIHKRDFLPDRDPIAISGLSNGCMSGAKPGPARILQRSNQFGSGRFQRDGGGSYQNLSVSLQKLKKQFGG